MEKVESEASYKKITKKHEKITNLYSAVMRGEELTTKHLIELGFDSKEITSFVKQGVLERKERGKYTFVSIYGLLNYGLTVFRYNKTEKWAKEFKDRCIDKCYEIDPKNPSVCFQLFFRYIYIRQFQEVWGLLDILIGDNRNPYDDIDPRFINDANYYLLLLSYLVRVPDKYTNRLRRMTFDNICVLSEDNRISDKDGQNEIRRLVLNGNLSEALPLQDAITMSEKEVNFKIQNTLILRILKNIKSNEMEIEREIKVLLSEGEYDSIIGLITKMYYGIRMSDEMFLLTTLVKKLIAMKEKEKPCNNILLSVLRDEYEEAIEMIPNDERASSLTYSLLKEIHANKEKQISFISSESESVEETPSNIVGVPEETDSIKVNNFILGNKGSTLKNNISLKNTRQQVMDIVQKISNNPGVVILPPMDDNLRDEVRKISYETPTLVRFELAIDNQPRVGLRYQAEFPKIMDVGEQFRTAREAFWSGNYERAIEINLDVITNYKGRVKPIVYYRLAGCYQRVGKPKCALDCYYAYEFYSRDDLERKDITPAVECLKQELHIMEQNSYAQINKTNDEGPKDPETKGQLLQLKRDN